MLYPTVPVNHDSGIHFRRPYSVMVSTLASSETEDPGLEFHILVKLRKRSSNPGVQIAIYCIGRKCLYYASIGYLLSLDATYVEPYLCRTVEVLVTR